MGQPAKPRLGSRTPDAAPLGDAARRLLILALIGAAYCAAVALGLQMRLPGSRISTIWPPNALLLTALLLSSPRRWPPILLTVALAHMAMQVGNGLEAWRILGQLVHNTLLGLGAAASLRRALGPRLTFATLREVLVFIGLAVALWPAVASLLFTAFLAAQGSSPDFLLGWRQGALSNAVAFLTLVPPALLCITQGRAWLRLASRRRVIEAALLAAATILLAALVFGLPPDSSSSNLHVLFIAPLPLLLWAAVRFGPAGAALSTAAVTVIAIAETSYGLGPFHGAEVGLRLLDLQLFSLAFTTPLLCLAALISERQAATNALARANAELEQRVVERTDDLLRANSDLRRRVGELSSLNQISQALASWPDLDAALAEVGGAVRALFGARLAIFWRLDRRGDTLAPLAAPADLGATALLLADDPSAREAISARRAVLLRPGEAAPACLPGAGRTLAGGALLLPLSARANPVGLLAIGEAAAGHSYSPADLALAETIGSAAAAAIENAELARQAQAEAAEQERRRLARELHDSVSQALFAANTVADVLPLLYERDGASGRQALADLQRLTRTAQAEMRALLFELRPASLEQASLSELLPTLAGSFDARLGSPITAQIAAAPPLPAEVQVALYRIAQEALHNVVKHARAGAVRLELTLDPPLEASAGGLWRGLLSMVVSDDGVGFDPARPPAGRMGLTSIRERAQQIGASCVIESGPGAGTLVIVEWEGGQRRPEG